MDPQSVTPSESSSGNKLSLPISIVVAGILIAGAIYLSKGNASTAPLTTTVAPAPITVSPVTADDHFIGNPSAPVTLVEFSDLECPYCKTFHATMRTLMDEYGKDGELAWVYRHFPLAQLHPKAPREAEAVECVNELSNKTATWNFINKLFEVTPSNNQLDETVLLNTAEALGVNKTALLSCMDSGKYEEKVNAQINDAIASGGRGTPHSALILTSEISEADEQVLLQKAALLGAIELVRVGPTRKIVTLSGALPIDFMRDVMDTLTTQ